jgi:hypothetical protein
MVIIINLNLLDMSTCSCPQPTELTDIPAVTCEIRIDQIQKIAFQRAGTPFATEVTFTTLATWTPLFAASDDTKIVVTPSLVNAQIVAGDAITSGGGDNTTLNGEVEVRGTNPSVFTAIGKNFPADTEKALKALACESDLVAYFFPADGKAIGDNPATEVLGIPVSSLFVGDRSTSGVGGRDEIAISFNLSPGWSDDLLVATPTDFNPITDF